MTNKYNFPDKLLLVATALANGASNQRMSDELGYALPTIENYVSELKTLLEV